jgi:hypothetical protein
VLSGFIGIGGGLAYLSGDFQFLRWPRLPDPPRLLETYTQERRRCHRKCLASIAQLERELGFDSDPLGPIGDEPGQTIPEYSIGTSRWARPFESEPYRVIRRLDGRTEHIYTDGRCVVLGPDRGYTNASRAQVGPMGRFS